MTPHFKKRARESINSWGEGRQANIGYEYSPECQVQVAMGRRHRRPHIATETLTHLQITDRRIFESTTVSAPHLLLRLALAHQATWAVSVPFCLAAF
jgi:hypothetical protein